MAKFQFCIYCLDCEVYMDLGEYDYEAGHFQGPKIPREHRRANTDWPIRRFLEEHSGHRIGFANDSDVELGKHPITPGWSKLIPDSSFCMVFKTDLDLWDEVEFPKPPESMSTWFSEADLGDIEGKATPNFPYNQARVGISVLTLRRPWFLLQCLTALLKNQTEHILFLVNQGDDSKGTMAVCDWWKTKFPHVQYIYNDPPKWPGAARAEVFQIAHDMGLEYIITVDDDSCLEPEAIDRLVQCADEHPEFHAISGFFVNRTRGRYMLGGYKEESGKHVNFDYTEKMVEAEYISNGFRLIRLNPLVLPDGSYEVGFTDWDYANQLSARGLRMAVYGGAGGWHKFFRGDEGEMVTAQNPWSYRGLRTSERTRRMRDYFISKWGYDPT